jgi:prolyl-tRNA synthetase
VARNQTGPLPSSHCLPITAHRRQAGTSGVNHQSRRSFEVNSHDDFKKKIDEPVGFLWAHWDGTRETEDRIAAENKATIRCIPFNRSPETGKCMVTGQPSPGRVVLAKA